ncbi:MAG: hypothetical protein ACWA5P_07280 [bacterium]
MNQNHNNPAFKKLLQKLQEESWQLELIISGFAIFGLFTSYEPIKLALYEAQNNDEIQKGLILTLAIISNAILLFNLLLHVLLRGLWIGALGLRYVSGEIDYDHLNYHSKFDRYLKKKVGSFDKYIATLENYCSIIFAVSFLLIFYVLATFFTFLCIAMVGNYLIDNEDIPKWVSQGVGIPLMIFLVVGMLLTFIDFLTQGFLKKKKWLAIIYYPVYRVFSIFTLSFLYKPLVYNFLDNKFGKRLSFLLVPLYIGILIISSFKYQKSNYYDLNSWESNNTMYFLDSGNYKDQIKEDEFINDVMIDGKVITKNHINVFMVLDDKLEDAIYSMNEGLKPEKDRRGLSSDIVIFGDGGNWRLQDSLKKAYLKELNTIHEITIDSTNYDFDFLPSRSMTEEFGFETFIKLDSLTEGKHVLRVFRNRIRRGDSIRGRIAAIPFWYYKN